mmetsp:Transcript_21003/g.31863  ORF Transcript_21003/g.31863 Transcript_21003/m.31863 type:complete len:155 (-) Transcript_21003:213-677(-)
MTLSAEEFSDESDSLLVKAMKLQKWDEAAKILSSTEGATMTKQVDKYGNLPLHTAIGFKAPDSLVLSILEEYPEAAKQHGTDYWLPLHIAAMWGTSTQVMEALIRAYPEALDDVGEPGIKGRTPRHFNTRFPHNRELLERPTAEWKELKASNQG